REVAVRDRGRDLGDVADLTGQVRGHRVDVVGQVLPDAGDALDLRLPAEDADRKGVAYGARHLGRERAELVDHRVDGVLQLEHLAARVDGDLAREVAVRDGGRDGRDVAHLRRQVRRQRVHVLRQVLPDAGDAAHLGLAAED